MLVWLGALLLGAWQSLPLLREGASAFDLAAAALWLVVGFAAWTVALGFGRRRYWPRR